MSTVALCENPHRHAAIGLLWLGVMSGRAAHSKATLQNDTFLPLCFSKKSFIQLVSDSPSPKFPDLKFIL